MTGGERRQSRHGSNYNRKTPSTKRQGDNRTQCSYQKMIDRTRGGPVPVGEVGDSNHRFAVDTSLVPERPVTPAKPGRMTRKRIMGQRGDDRYLVALTLPMFDETAPPPLGRTDLRTVIVSNKKNFHNDPLVTQALIRLRGKDNSSPRNIFTGQRAYYRWPAPKRYSKRMFTFETGPRIIPEENHKESTGISNGTEGFLSVLAGDVDQSREG